MVHTAGLHAQQGRADACACARRPVHAASLSTVTSAVDCVLCAVCDSKEPLFLSLHPSYAIFAV